MRSAMTKRKALNQSATSFKYGQTSHQCVQREHRNKSAMKTLIALIGLIIVFITDGVSAKSHPQFKSLSAVSVESSTDTSEWTETGSTNPTMNWETSSISGTTDVINPSTFTTDNLPSTTTEYVPSSNICQQSNSSSTEYIFPNPEDCTTFYMCSNGLPYLYDCPSGLVYNDVIHQCDYAYNVPSCNI